MLYDGLRSCFDSTWGSDQDIKSHSHIQVVFPIGIGAIGFTVTAAATAIAALPHHYPHVARSIRPISGAKYSS